MSYNHRFKENIENNDTTIERTEAGVKWYLPEKGYGFLIQDHSLKDIMIHFSTLDAVKCPYIKEGDRVVCEIGAGRHGLQVLRVIEVKYGSSETRSLSSFLNSRTTPFDLENLEETEGVVKWFKPDKRYGFISPDDGEREIFFHVSVMLAAGYYFLSPGVRVSIKFSSTERGREARILTVLDQEERKTL
ncbi:MAG: cold shock domain-containing protein [Alphaproteobacteria bacterium]|nr:cold shock domain-containing protein [Alphaproteobacteria bacterium]